MNQKIKQKYNFPVAFAMVVGVVIGSGIFFKTEVILKDTNGNVLIGAFAWLFGGIIMLISSYTFSTFASKYQKMNGVVDYAEAIVSKRYSYKVAMFQTIFFYPAMTGVLSSLTVMYFFKTCGINISLVNGESWKTLVLIFASIGLLLFLFLTNIFLPKTSGKVQVITTYIKILPLIIITLIGIVYGLTKQVNNFDVIENKIIEGNFQSMRFLVDNFKTSMSVGFKPKLLFGAIVSSAFAYEGWIVAASINSELKDSKKTLPKAIIFGSIFVVIIYLTYYLGIVGSTKTNVLMHKDGGASYAFKQLFGPLAVILNAFVFISCLGTTNGLSLANVRTLYSMSYRDIGPNPKYFKKLTKKSSMPFRAGIVATLFSIFWLVYFVASLDPKTNFKVLAFDVSEIPIVGIYMFYIPIYITYMLKSGKGETKFKRFVMPALSLAVALFMGFALIYKHYNNLIGFFLLFFLSYVMEKYFAYRHNEKTLLENTRKTLLF